jgi:hypothetical protein
MVNKQLFSKKPELNVVLHLLKLYGLNDFDENYSFNKIDLEKKKIVYELNKFKETLDQYYLPCKSKKYLNNITLKRSITILRQVIKEYNYKLISREKYISGKKYLSYNLKQIYIEGKKKPNLVVKFD